MASVVVDQGTPAVDEEPHAVTSNVGEETLGPLEEVVRILQEAYNPYVIRVKLLPTLRIRAMKILGLVINQKTGQCLFGWNGKENRIYDRLGAEVDALFLLLYGHPLRQEDVIRFVHRRLHYAFITAVSTTIQLVLTYHALVTYSVVVTWLVAPVTMLERQWATSVTKNPPRLLRHVVLNQLQWPLTQIIGEQARHAKEFGTADKRFETFLYPRRVPREGLHTALVFTEMAVGATQALCALVLVFLPLAMVRYPELKHAEFAGGYSMLFFLNCIRLVKELCNWISPLIEKYITPKKYQWGEQCLQEFARSYMSVPEECLRAVTLPLGRPTASASTGPESSSLAPSLPTVVVTPLVEANNARLHEYATAILGPARQLPFYLTIPKLEDDERARLLTILHTAAE